MPDIDKSKTEIIAISSGKGGTGKTITSASLGFVLMQADHNVLLIDADPGTDGLSLFLLGKDGKERVKRYKLESTFTGALNAYRTQNSFRFESGQINRTEKEHFAIYDALISGKEIYSDFKKEGERDEPIQLSKSEYRESVAKLFRQLHEDGEYDYVIVDTRGGYSFESTDICALADSFIVITEPDFSSFHQDRNLINRISIAAGELNSKAFLRGIIVNKAVVGEEKEFRDHLVEELPMIRYHDTYAISLDEKVIKAYRRQMCPYLKAPESKYVSHTLDAFAHILHLVTAKWEKERILKWNELAKKIAQSYRKEKHKKKIWHRFKFAIPIVIAFIIGFFATDFTGAVKNWLIKGELDLITKVYDRNLTNFERKNIFLELYRKNNLTFDGIDLAGFDLRDMNLANVRLRRANLSYSEMAAINLRNADLEDADLRRANLKSADLREANLAGANLSGAQLGLAIFQGAILDSADLRGADLFLAHISEEQLETAILDSSTILPDDPRIKINE